MIERLYYVLQIIKNEEEPISAKNIKDRLLDYDIDVDIKTVYQAIKNINTLTSLMFDKELIQTIRKRGYCIGNDLFEDGAMQYLYDTILFNRNLSGHDADGLIDTLTTLSSSSQTQRLNMTTRVHHQLNFDLFLFLTIIIQAINKQENIYFHYIDYKVENNKLVEVNRQNGNLNKDFYVVSPYQIILRNSQYYLLGYFDKRKDHLSIYRLDRMRLVREHSSPYIDISEQFDLDQEIERNVNMYISNEKEDLEIIFHESIIREVVNQFGTQMKIKRAFDHQYHAIIEEVPITEGLIGWLMMLSSNIKVEMPLSLKDTIIERINKMKQMYL